MQITLVVDSKKNALCLSQNKKQDSHFSRLFTYLFTCIIGLSYLFGIS